MSRTFASTDLGASAVLVNTLGGGFDPLYRHLPFVRDLLWGTMHQPAITGIEGMIGSTGTIFRGDEAKRKVFCRGEIWDAVCLDGMSLGERVEIVGFERMKIVVRRKP